MPYHFGVKILNGTKGLNLTRDKYAIVNNKSSIERGKVYSDEWCQAHLKNCLKNYDLNMHFFSCLNKDTFDLEINNFINTNKSFKQVNNLNMYDGVSGYYIMVLDLYCQIYIGTTSNIKKRIQEHWRNSKSFDRLIFPTKAVESSILSIDSFRALDTTRIYSFETDETYKYEDFFINQFSSEFICNRISGGRLLTLDPRNAVKKRNLI